MPPPNFFTRARRIFQNASPQSNHPHLNPTDSAHHSHYETDGSSYEMLVVESPSKPQQLSQHQPSHHNSKQNQTELQKHKLEKTPEQQQPEKQPEQCTPPPLTPAEPQTPSQKLPVALRRIDATPTNLPDTPGYNLRSRTRSQAPPTPQQRPTPARSRRRELRQAPSAHTTSGIAGRPSIVSRRQIDESSYVTLRALCRSFGLPSSGTKAQLRSRAIEKFEHRRVLDEQTQPLDNEPKLGEDLRDAAVGVQQSNDKRAAKGENEENSGTVQKGVAQEERLVGSLAQEPGKQITTSTVKHARRVKQLPVEATIPATSDEPSVHAKSDAPEDDPCRQAANPAVCSTANSPTPAAAQEAEKTAQPTVSSTGAAVNSPDSPRPPPPHPTPRLTDHPFPFPTQRRPEGPTESVDARGGDLDVAAIFRGLASGRRELSPAEYEAALRTLQENAPGRPQPMQIPINAARVSLNTLPTTPLLNFKPLSVRASAAVSGVIPSQRRSPLLPNNVHVQSSRIVLNSSVPDRVRACNEEAAQIFDDDRATAPKETKVASATRAPEQGKNVNAEATEQESCVLSGKELGHGAKRDSANSNGNKERRAVEQRSIVDTERIILETPSKLEPGAQLEPELAELNKIPLPSIFEGARGGPHEGNIVGICGMRTPQPSTEVAPTTVEGDKLIEPEREEGCKDTKGDREATRSGFATPRELVRRFNRFRNGHLNDDEDMPLKHDDDGDPATSLLRRNARRSSSGVPLFYSARRPSTAGRSISKARTSSKAREAQDHLRRMDRLHNLSGRASFRVKRPLSASAGALLVDLRRTSSSSGPLVERMDQRGSFQAELARRPPPMAASALKILNELQKIQEDNRAHVNRKRAVSPPPLPPSVVKRARRSGQFALRRSRMDPSSPAKGRNETERFNRDSNVPLFALDTSSDQKESGSSAPVGRQTPRVPLVASGAGKRRSKRSRTGRFPSVALSAIEDQVEKCTEENNASDKEDDIRNDANNASTKRRREREDAPNVEENIHHHVLLDKSTKMPLRGTRPVAVSKLGTQDRSKGILLPDAKVERSDTSTVPVIFANPSNGGPFQFPQQSGVEQPPVSNKLASDLLMTGTESPERVDKRASEGEYPCIKDAKEPEYVQTEPRTGNDLFVSDRPSTILQSTIGGQNMEQEAKNTDTMPSTATAARRSSALQGQENENRPSPEKGKAVVGYEVNKEVDGKQNTVGSMKRIDKPEASPPQLQPQDGRFHFQTTQHSNENGEQAPSGSAVPSFLKSTSPVGSGVGIPASPFARPVKPFSFNGKKEEEKDDINAESKRSVDASIPSKNLQSFGPFGGKEGSAGVLSVPSIPSDEGGSGMQFGFGTSTLEKPIQTETKSQIQEKEASSSYPEKDKAVEKENAPAPSSSQAVRAASVVFLGSKEAAFPTPKQTAHKNANLEPGRQCEDRSNVFVTSPIKPSFGVQSDGKSEGLPSSKTPATLSVHGEPSVGTKRHAPPNSKDTMTTSTPPASTSNHKVGESAADSNPLATSDVVPASDKLASPFTSGPFSERGGQSGTKPAFSFSATPKATGRAPEGPFADTQFKSPFSSSNSSNMFVFGSSTGSAAAVKPAPSISFLGKSATPEEAKSNPFAQPASTTPFGSQQVAEPDGMAQNSGKTFGMSSSSGLSATFGLPETNTASGFGSSFGSSPALFNSGANSSFAAASTTQVFGGSSGHAPMFGSTGIPSTPFGASTGPAVAQTFGASSSGPASSDMLGASTGGTLAPGFGGAGPGSFTFGNSNASTFGGNSNQPNPFNQNGNLASTSSAGMFGTQAGAFNVGSATRAPQTQRRRLRGRRTLR